MLTKDQHCLESILEAINRILKYTSCVNTTVPDTDGAAMVCKAG
jgi:hypothetical protein